MIELIKSYTLDNAKNQFALQKGGDTKTIFEYCKKNKSIDFEFDGDIFTVTGILT
jgi:hypothetical protein